MRVSAGIILIVLGFLSLAAPGQIADFIAGTTATSVEEYVDIYMEQLGWVVLSGLFMLGLISGGGICALLKKAYWWAFAGAIGAIVAGIALIIVGPMVQPPMEDPVIQTAVVAFMGVLFTLVAVLALVFLLKRRHEFKGSFRLGVIEPPDPNDPTR